FDVYDNGRKQDLQFMEFVSVDTGRRTEGTDSSVKLAPGIDTSVPHDLAAKDVKRVVAFVIDDVTIPAADLARVREMLTDFVDNKMQAGDLVAVVRTFGGKGLLEQFTSDKQILRRAIATIAPRAIPPYLALTDNGTSTGVIINTLDAPGVRITGAVAKFNVRQGKSARGGGTFAGDDENLSFGRTADTLRLGEQTLTEQLSLRALAGSTGGVSVVNSNNFSAGLDRVLTRSRAYYRIAFKPSEKFDTKFHKLEVKVRRGGTRVYTAEGYYAYENKQATARTKEDEIVHATTSPLARRDLDVAADLQYKFTPNNQVQLDINVLIDAHKLNFTRTQDGKYHTSFDVVEFVFDQV